MLYPDAKGNGTVIIPRLPRPGEELLFGILHIFRYTIRRMSGGEFPRGFLAPGLTPRANACKKLKEELGVPAGQLTELALCFGNVLALPLSLGGTGERRVIMAGMGPLPHRHRVREISPVSSTVRRRGRSMQRLQMMRAVIMRSIIHFFPTEFLALSVICISRWRGIRHVKKQIVAARRRIQPGAHNHDLQ